jgi:hypothetical protein
MPLVFSYGTLQDDDVQMATFGRLLRGERDELPGFEPALVRISDPATAAVAGRTHYANVRSSGRTDDRVSGTVFEITETELTASDRYEEDAGYARILVALASGKRAWVYRCLLDHT